MIRRLLRALLVLVLAGALGIGALFAVSWWDVKHTRLATLQRSSAHVTGELKVLQVTDVHDMGPGEQRDGIVQQATDLQPDLIALTGDLVNMTTRDLSRIEPFVAQLAATRIPVFYVPGNHEWASGRLPQVVQMLQRHGVVVMQNTHQSLDGSWGQLDVVGTDDYYSGVGDLAAAMRGTRPEAFHLVLSHSPEGVFDDLARHRADLAISGHTHGGQIRLPWVGAIYTPGGGLFPRLDKGLFSNGESTLYIDSGVAASIPLRINDRSQITLITIQPG